MTASRRSVARGVYEGPLGPLMLEAGPRGLARLLFAGRAEPPAETAPATSAVASAIVQLGEYFAGERRAFELPLDLAGTPFQQRVWQELREIPYGTTISYTELARRVGRPAAVRAVGAAVGRTPVPIIVPCHRVVATSGALTGYGGGLPRKQALLDLERRPAALPSSREGQPRRSSARRVLYRSLKLPDWRG